MLYPLTFHPIFKERVWGNRQLDKLYGKALPPAIPIGESWEISDREGDVSVIANGPLAGKNLHWLVENCSDELLGKAKLERGRFPLLIKILDAHEKLSLQVHPPTATAGASGGDPKTELWYIAAAAPGAELFVGLRRGVTREQFERRLREGTVADCFHRITVRAGDAMFLPSGRVHAIGAGLVIFEVQQNSDTTYRVFDWNRVGLDGQPRTLHIKESLASINFNDFEPALVTAEAQDSGPLQFRQLANDLLFRADLVSVKAGESRPLDSGELRVIGVVEGRMVVSDASLSAKLDKGQFCMIPAAVNAQLDLEPGARFLLVRPGG